jgi:hypothetical protein
MYVHVYTLYSNAHSAEPIAVPGVVPVLHPKVSGETVCFMSAGQGTYYLRALEPVAFQTN